MIISQEMKDVKCDYKRQKEASLKLADIYQQLFDGAELAADLDRWERRAQAVRGCGTFLSFDKMQHVETHAIHYKITAANFCRLVLCPMCQWRRGKKLYSDMLRIWSAIFEQYREIEFDNRKHRIRPRLRALLLTLTVPNVPGDQLRTQLDKLSYAWKKYTAGHSRVWKDVKGYFKTLEITYNSQSMTYHPHIHVLCLVDDDYFRAGYIKQSEWLSAWRKATSDSSITQLDIRVLCGQTPEAMLRNLNEVCKYTCKPADFLRAGSDVVATLDHALQGVRRASFGGWLKEVRASLKIDQEDDMLFDMQSDEWEKLGEVWLHWSNSLGEYV